MTEAEAIVRELAHELCPFDPVMETCWFCCVGGCAFQDRPKVHGEDCAWRRAREWVAAHPRRDSDMTSGLISRLRSYAELRVHADKAATFMAAANRLEQFGSIISGLADSDPYASRPVGEPRCRFCEAEPTKDHLPECPWRRAVEWVAAHPEDQ